MNSLYTQVANSWSSNFGMLLDFFERLQGHEQLDHFQIQHREE